MKKLQSKLLTALTAFVMAMVLMMPFVNAK